ncbi:MAG: SDR family oxidoreductase [bacterium]|nr:short-chain dehydrogenase [Deltaproteobacteria bacterium]MCP4906893.1 SDR family oxidoreductase [bacterium]
MGNKIGGPDSLKGQRAIVLGASAGIGLATAETLLHDGADLLICARDGDRLEAAARSLREAVPEARGSLSTRICDAMDGEQVHSAVEEAAGETGLDIAITIPGGANYCPVLGYEDEEFSATIDMNIRPTYLMIKYAGLAMVGSGGGAIVIVSSTASTLSSPFLSAYCASKAACDQLVKVAADEIGQYDIRVNAVRPGLTRTGATDAIFENRPLVDTFLAEQPIEKDGAPEDIARAIRFLAGPESAWITGQCLTVDGGHTIRKFPWLEDVARSIKGDALFESIERGELA